MCSHSPVSTLSVSILDPGNLFVSTNPTLQCSVSARVDSSVVDVPVSASVVWDGPGGTSFSTVSGPLSGASTTLSITLTNAMTTDSGDYTCRASVSTTSTTYPQVITSSEGSDSRSITICELLYITRECDNDAIVHQMVSPLPPV